MTKRMLIMLGLILLLVAGLAYGFYLHVQTLIASAPKPFAQTVTTTRVAALEWQPQVSAVGTLVPVRGVDVTTEVTGLVRSVNFKSGQEVKAGAVLLQMNADTDIAQLQSLKASADQSALVLKRDQAQLAFQGVAQAVVDADLADLASKRALVAQQSALVDKKTIRAPFAGRLGITTVNPGQYLNPGDKIVTLQTISPIYIDFYLPQQRVSHLTVGLPVAVSNDAYVGQSFSGRITAINPKVDPATRNVQVEATLPNTERRLLPGMFGTANVDVGERQRFLTLPQAAVSYNPYGATVFVVLPPGVAASGSAPASATTMGAPASAASGPFADKPSVQQVFVTTGQTRGDQVAIVLGLTEGQEVVTSGQLKLKNGTPIVVDNRVQPANSPNPTPQEQ